ncbi:MAG: Cys-Xaa-Xaa-Xaa repeat radical SAM target protein, partial [Alphaproteobacteria bacterium]|nr:Cys-Xaa-Xaa-Xaa repeat radical SAM target protein [Alphaproteobacteria bacterium]
MPGYLQADEQIVFASKPFLQNGEHKMNIRSQPTKNLNRRGFLKSGTIVIPSLAVMGLGLTVPLQARADCGGDCEGSCTGDCSGNCTASCASDCSTGCENGCLNSCTAHCLNDCEGACSGQCKDS